MDVGKPRAKTDASIGVVVKKARDAALPDAVNAARADAIRVARAAGVRLGRVVGVEREVPPYGWGGDASDGVWAPNQWCRTWRGRYKCNVPRAVTLRVTLTVAAS